MKKNPDDPKLQNEKKYRWLKTLEWRKKTNLTTNQKAKHTHTQKPTEQKQNKRNPQNKKNTTTINNNRTTTRKKPNNHTDANHRYLPKPPYAHIPTPYLILMYPTNAPHIPHVHTPHMHMCTSPCTMHARISYLTLPHTPRDTCTHPQNHAPHTLHSHTALAHHTTHDIHPTHYIPMHTHPPCTHHESHTHTIHLTHTSHTMLHTPHISCARTLHTKPPSPKLLFDDSCDNISYIVG